MLANSYPSLHSISDPFKGILLDAYGVFWRGNRAGLFPGSKEVMERLVQEGKIVGILSNATQLSEKEIEKFKPYGLLPERHFHFFITSGDVTRTLLCQEELPFPTPRQTFCLFGTAHPHYSSHAMILGSTPYREVFHPDEADFLFISVPHLKGEDQTDPHLFKDQVAAIRKKGLPMVCPNPDRFAHEGNPPRAVVRQGSIAALYEEMGGFVFYTGKPSRRMYEAAMDKFSLYGLSQPHEILMVGDTPETDSRGARNFGMPAALVTQTGILAERVSQSSLKEVLQALLPSDAPDYWIDSLASKK